MSAADLGATQAALADLMRRVSSLVGDAETSAVAARIAAGNDRLSPVEQVDIYREQFFLRHVDVLREDFRSIEHLLGDDAFEALSKAYLSAVPPASYSLRDLGHGMARFVAEHEPWSSDALVADLARVEWAFVEAFDAPEAPPLDVTTIASAPEDAWPRARMIFQPSVQRVALRYPAHDYRISARKDEEPARPAEAKTWVVVYRGPAALQYIDIDADAFALLDELMRGAPLGEACERAAEKSGGALETFEAKLGAWFQEWTTFGWISRVDFGASPDR
ncbi:MAG: putative DNA-binding domain-containing protein [Labilithrix sp.]|nr:putative DNA-binding domain-containing protein [Labilithrix sp.]